MITWLRKKATEFNVFADIMEQEFGLVATPPAATPRKGTRILVEQRGEVRSGRVRGVSRDGKRVWVFLDGNKGVSECRLEDCRFLPAVLTPEGGSEGHGGQAKGEHDEIMRAIGHPPEGDGGEHGEIMREIGQ